MAAESSPAPERPLPPDLRRDPLDMTDEELAAALRERIDEFNLLWMKARKSSIQVVLSMQALADGQPGLAVAIVKMVPL